MNKNQKKDNKLPKKICQYREDCYRKNPVHFNEYSHPHLENILFKGYNKTTKEYQIPDELQFSKDVILVQLKILENIFPQFKIQPDEDETVSEELNLETNSDVTSNNRCDKNVCEPKASTSNSQEITKSFESKKTEVKKSDVAVGDKLKIVISTKRKSPSPDVVIIDSENSKPGTSKSNSNDDTSRLSKKPKITRNIHDYIPVVVPRGQMAKKLEMAAPYNFFLTTITDSPATHNEPLSITLQEILDESLGEIESSVQINFMIDIGWLLGHYYFAGCLETPLLVLYGDDHPELSTISQKKPQVTAIKVNMSSPFATHHSKIMLFGYKDGSMRIIISTANLYEDDWHNRTQGIWMSPKLNPLPENSDTSFGESPTEFRNDLMLYLVEYKISKLQPWITRIRKTDFRSINVFFVASVPGGFRESPNRGHSWGHARVGSLLNKHAGKIDENSPIVAQSSSIGSLGQNLQSWVQADICNSFRRDSTPLGLRRLPQFKMIYPSYGNVKNSHDGLLGGGCLPYGKKTNDKQPWLKNHLCQWKAKNRFRSQAMPHIKTYGRWSDEGLHWFILTSANLSKAAWGAFNKVSKIEPPLRIMNYEAGVLFLPKFIIGEDTFPLDKNRDGIPSFPIPYDIPLTPYGPDDAPFLMDYLLAETNG